ncbi:hypothetical protein SS50377_24744 [Spironucleus salmonicida]|uniref:Uncharacterized protein n=1 Tax=Spironucleus salmonicida TaxID=348837 RepID=A0A9P8LQZ0_9EUKA|nr:hypothetical protein SS50377_24744 [Spironucleus salmonicida]
MGAVSQNLKAILGNENHAHIEPDKAQQSQVPNIVSHTALPSLIHVPTSTFQSMIKPAIEHTTNSSKISSSRCQSQIGLLVNVVSARSSMLDNNQQYK